MLNIFAESILIATRLGRLSDAPLPRHDLRRTPREFQDIEGLRTGDNPAYFERHHLRAEALETQLQETGWDLLPRAPDAGPAREYAHPDYAGLIGVIAPYSKDFCAGCNRLRVTHTGDLRLCLFGNVGIPLRPWLQDDADRVRLVAALQAQLGLKAIGHRLHEGETGMTSNLSTIGG